MKMKDVRKVPRVARDALKESYIEYKKFQNLNVQKLLEHAY